MLELSLRHTWGGARGQKGGGICVLWTRLVHLIFQHCRSIVLNGKQSNSLFNCSFSAMAGIASGICFIAMRDIDETSKEIYPDTVDRAYGWSFILAWAGTGLVLIQGFVFLCLLRMDYDDVAESNNYKTMYSD